MDSLLVLYFGVLIRVFLMYDTRFTLHFNIHRAGIIWYLW